MPWPKSTVPKFGNWDKNEDLSYSVIFDKVRAEKELFLHIPDDDLKDSPLAQRFYKNSPVGVDKKTSHSFISDKAREDRKGFLHTSQEDRRYTPQYKNELKNSELTAGTGASYDNDWGLRARHSGNRSPKSPLGGRILGEQQHPSTFQADPWDLREVHTSISPGAPSRQPMQIGATQENGFFNEKQHVDRDDKGYYGKLHAIPSNAPGSGMHMYEEKPAAAKIKSSQQSPDTSRKADMQGKPVVPKFGDWDSGDGFSAVFNNVRNERSLKHNTVRPTVQADSPLRPDEDLYNTKQGSVRRKSRRGWCPILCCSDPYS